MLDTTRLQDVILVAERIATIAELVRSTDVAAQDSRFIPIITDNEAVEALTKQVAELREYVAIAKRHLAKGMTFGKAEIFSELLIGMSQIILVCMMPASSVSVSIDVVTP